MTEQPRAELDIDAVGRVGEQIGAQDAEDGLEHRDRDEADDQHVERAEARCTSTLSMTTWKNSGETSAKNCRKNEATSTSPSSVPVFVDRAEKPGDVEAPRQIDQPGAARHQHEPAVPYRFEFGSAFIRVGRGDSGS